MFSDELLNVRGKPQEPEEVRNCGSVFSRATSDLFVAEAQVFDEAVKRVGGFNRSEVLTLNVLNQRDFEQLLICKILNDNRYFREASQLRCPPAPLASHKLVPILVPPHDERLDDPLA